MTSPDEGFFSGLGRTGAGLAGALERGEIQPVRPPITSGIPQFEFPSPEEQFRERQFVGPEEPRGRQLLDQQIRSAGFKPGTKAYDEWILSLREIPTDPEYNVELRIKQGPAYRRRRFREDPDTYFPEGEQMTPEDVEAFRRQQQAEEEGRFKELPPTILGPDGEPIADQGQFIIGPEGEVVPLPSEQAAEVGFGTLNTQDAVRSGQFVWLGENVQEDPLARGQRTTVQGAYMSVTDAAMMPYRWSSAQIAYAQEAMGLDPTGFVDQSLIQGWEQIVASAAGYAQAGRRVDPFTLLDLTYDATQAAQRGRGGGGGGGVTPLSRSQAKMVLNQVMLDEVGREATDTEVDRFHGNLVASGTVDPTQYAIDWVRGVAGGEAATFQAATDYYQAMLAVLGAQTEAEEGPQ